jgi:hypothetical protein
MDSQEDQDIIEIEWETWVREYSGITYDQLYDMCKTREDMSDGEYLTAEYKYMLYSHWQCEGLSAAEAYIHMYRFDWSHVNLFDAVVEPALPGEERTEEQKEYDRYLDSKEWKEKRRLVIERERSPKT